MLNQRALKGLPRESWLFFAEHQTTDNTPFTGPQKRLGLLRPFWLNKVVKWNMCIVRCLGEAWWIQTSLWVGSLRMLDLRARSLQYIEAGSQDWPHFDKTVPLACNWPAKPQEITKSPCDLKTVMSRKWNYTVFFQMKNSNIVNKSDHTYVIFLSEFL